jgi:phage tail-like protein
VSDPAVALRFSVRIDDLDLGAFMKCDGLGIEMKVEEREEGGNNGFVHQLPGRLKFSRVKLTRPINGDSAKVAQWFSSLATAPTRTTAEIVARRSDGRKVAQWNLIDVLPVRWTGPSLSADSNQVATETLELAHHGFVDAGDGFDLEIDIEL